MQSFGGGNATFEIIRREFVERRRWVTEDEFARDWSLCRTAPGMNLLAMTILIGRALLGARGVAISLFGLLLPSGLVTIALTVAFRATQTLPQAQAAMRGVVPATVGVGIASTYRTLAPLVRGGRKRGGAAAIAAFALPALGFSTLVWAPPIAPFLVAGSFVGALAWWRSGSREARNGGDER